MNFLLWDPLLQLGTLYPTMSRSEIVVKWKCSEGHATSHRRVRGIFPNHYQRTLCASFFVCFRHESIMRRQLYTCISSADWETCECFPLCFLSQRTIVDSRIDGKTHGHRLHHWLRVRNERCLKHGGCCLLISVCMDVLDYFTKTASNQIGQCFLESARILSFTLG